MTVSPSANAASTLSTGMRSGMGRASMVTPRSVSAPHRDSFFLRRDLRAHFAQNVQHRAVALCGVTMQARNAYASGAERTHTQEECGV